MLVKLFRSADTLPSNFSTFRTFTFDCRGWSGSVSMNGFTAAEVIVDGAVLDFFSFIKLLDRVTGEKSLHFSVKRNGNGIQRRDGRFVCLSNYFLRKKDAIAAWSINDSPSLTVVLFLDGDEMIFVLPAFVKFS